ncbi:MAG: recombination-associated protein RdgC [Gammaproteobacteria bacterium]
MDIIAAPFSTAMDQLPAMWFKNLVVYRFPEIPEITPESLEASLQGHEFQPCPRHQPASLGWTAPLGRSGQQLVHTTDGRMMICLRREERVLPAASVRERLEEKLAAIEEAEGRKVRGKEKMRLKEEITLDMLPQAFTRSGVTFAYIDPKQRWLIVDSTTASKAEELVGKLRETLGSLPVRPIQVNHAPADIMTQWLNNGRAGDDFELGEDCVLQDPASDGATVRMRRQSLSSDEIPVHLNAGKRVNQLAVNFLDRISLVIDESLGLKRMKFLDLVLDQAEAADMEGAGAEDAAQRFDTEFALMGAEINHLLERTLATFGGDPD